MNTILPLIVTSVGVSLSLLAVGEETPTQVEAAPSITGIVNKISLKDCPNEVQAAIVKASLPGELDEIKVITKGDVTTYLAEIESPGDRDTDLFISETGRILETREEIDLKQAPVEVGTALISLAAKEEDIEEVMRRVVGDTTTYLAEVERKGAPDLDVELDTSGRILSQTEEVED